MNITTQWYQKNFLSIILFPLSLIYRFIIFIRKFFYKIKLFKSHKINLPVIIVGNITVGGTGKTPLVIALVDALKKDGFQPGVILRGYRGKNKMWPTFVDKNSDPALVGDEAVLIAKNTGVPVVAGPNRVADARMIASHCNIIISDDGLQHYALRRDIEIAVIDASRGFGNGFCLPAGPLRESISRLKSVDFIVMNARRDKSTSLQSYFVPFKLDNIVNINNENITLTFAELKNKKIMAVAAIGNPDRFFAAIREKEINFETKIFQDHHAFQSKDFSGIKEEMILMTEKDAVKCRAFADDRFWFVKGHAELDADFFEKLLSSARIIT